MKVAIVIITYNISPEVFILQIESIRKFCKDEDYTIEIIDNSSDIERAKDIYYHATDLGLMYRKTHSSSENGSDSHSFAANTSYQLLKGVYEAFIYLDHDCFPVKPFSIVDILGEGKVIAGIGQNTVNTYLWPGCLFFKKMDEIDFTFSHELKLDTGGGLRKVIEIYGKEKCIFFDEEYVQNPNYKGEYDFYTLIFKGTFLHCINASNWNPIKGNKERLNSLLNIITEKVHDK